jgi:hypothetical protein
MARIGDIVVDCAHPAALARFWAAVLDDYAVAPYDEAELARLRERGIHDPEDDPSVLVEPTGAGPRFFFVKVPESKTVKNRLHLDLRAPEFEPELNRLIALGAQVYADLPEWTTLLDPEGNEFCLLKK